MNFVQNNKIVGNETKAEKYNFTLSSNMLKSSVLKIKGLAIFTKFRQII